MKKWVQETYSNMRYHNPNDLLLLISSYNEAVNIIVNNNYVNCPRDVYFYGKPCIAYRLQEGIGEIEIF